MRPTIVLNPEDIGSQQSIAEIASQLVVLGSLFMTVMATTMPFIGRGWRNWKPFRWWIRYGESVALAWFMRSAANWMNASLSVPANARFGMMCAAPGAV